VLTSVWRRRSVALLLGALLAACGSDTPEVGQPQSPVVPQTTEVLETPSPVPVLRSPLSGRAGAPGAPILAVKIDNTRGARPHLGLTKADVVYVEQVESGITRFAVLFSSDMPAQVGPIRSARITDIDILAPFGPVAFAYSGAQSRLRPTLAKASFIDVSGDRGAKGYYRQSGRTAPWNFMGTPAQLLERAGAGVALSRPVGWEFDDEPTTLPGTDILKATAKWPGQTLTATWTPSTNSWLIGVDGRTLDAAEGGVVTASTVIVQYVTYVASTYRDKWGNTTPEAELRGEGKALVLRDGRALEARWSRPVSTEVTRYTTTSGEVIPFAPGAQWILLVSKDRPVVLDTPAPSVAPSASRTATP
jgi:hypothetical protein